MPSIYTIYFYKKLFIIKGKIFLYDMIMKFFYFPSFLLCVYVSTKTSSAPVKLPVVYTNNLASLHVVEISGFLKTFFIKDRNCLSLMQMSIIWVRRLKQVLISVILILANSPS